MITNFSCFKVSEKKSDQSPDYTLSAKVGEQYVNIGAGWIKESKGTKYISFKLSDPYMDKPGFTITMSDVPEKAEYPDNSDVDKIPF
jgi:uncharacterized protein (DUF736 family)